MNTREMHEQQIFRHFIILLVNCFFWCAIVAPCVHPLAACNTTKFYCSNKFILMSVLLILVRINMNYQLMNYEQWARVCRACNFSLQLIRCRCFTCDLMISCFWTISNIFSFINQIPESTTSMFSTLQFFDNEAYTRPIVPWIDYVLNKYETKESLLSFFKYHRVEVYIFNFSSKYNMLWSISINFQNHFNRLFSHRIHIVCCVPFRA